MSSLKYNTYSKFFFWFPVQCFTLLICLLQVYRNIAWSQAKIPWDSHSPLLSIVPGLLGQRAYTYQWCSEHGLHCISHHSPMVAWISSTQRPRLNRFLGPSSRIQKSQFSRSEWSLWVCISKKLPGCVHAAGLQTTCWMCMYAA